MRPSGYAQVVDPDQPLVEFDTVMCGHCGAHIRVKPGTVSTVYLIFDPQAWRYTEVAGAGCRMCMRPVCLRCHALGSCLPLERWLATVEASR